MAQKNVKAARWNKASNKVSSKGSFSTVESLEGRQLFSTYGTVNISLTDITPSAQVDYTRNGVDQSWSAGEFVWSRSATNPGTYANKGAKGGLMTFCIEPDQDVTTPVVNYTVSDLNATTCGKSTGPLTATQANAIRELWGRFHGTLGTDGTKAAAFQMAIWELVCDNDRNLSTGTFSVDNTTATDIAVKTQAQSWLNQLTGCGPKANLLALTSPIDQDQVFEVTGCTPPIKYTCVHTTCDHSQYHCILKVPTDCLDRTSHYSGGGCSTGGTSTSHSGSGSCGH